MIAEDPRAERCGTCGRIGADCICPDVCQYCGEHLHTLVEVYERCCDACALQDEEE